MYADITVTLARLDVLELIARAVVPLRVVIRAVVQAARAAGVDVRGTVAGDVAAAGAVEPAVHVEIILVDRPARGQRARAGAVGVRTARLRVAVRRVGTGAAERPAVERIARSARRADGLGRVVVLRERGVARRAVKAAARRLDRQRIAVDRPARIQRRGTRLVPASRARAGRGVVLRAAGGLAGVIVALEAVARFARHGRRRHRGVIRRGDARRTCGRRAVAVERDGIGQRRPTGIQRHDFAVAAVDGGVGSHVGLSPQRAVDGHVRAVRVNIARRRRGGAPARERIAGLGERVGAKRARLAEVQRLVFHRAAGGAVAVILDLQRQRRPLRGRGDAVRAHRPR